MDEREALRWLASRMPVGDDCYSIERPEGNLLITTDMLHSSTDFPAGITDYTIGWRSAAVSLSDIAGMGGEPLALVIAYGSPEFDFDSLEEFLTGAEDLCGEVGGEIVGGDLDHHDELTITSTALGVTDDPVLRTGANIGDLVAVTGGLGRTGAALKLFEDGRYHRANELFRFTPRIDAGIDLAEFATSMMDISDGLARSLHQLAGASDVGFRVLDSEIPYVPEVEELADSAEVRRDLGLFTGEDYELLLTAPEKYEFELATRGAKVIGKVVADGVKIKIGREMVDLEDRGYVH